MNSVKPDNAGMPPDPPQEQPRPEAPATPLARASTAVSAGVRAEAAGRGRHLLHWQGRADPASASACGQRRDSL